MSVSAANIGNELFTHWLYIKRRYPVGHLHTLDEHSMSSAQSCPREQLWSCVAVRQLPWLQ